MTYNDIINIAKRLDKDIKDRIDEDVVERMEILSTGKLTKEELEKMEECLYMSLVIQEYLNSEAEILEEERDLLLEEMEEMYNEYVDLLARAKIEKKLGRKKRMALELRRIREELFNRKNRVKKVKNQLEENQKNQDALKKSSSVENMENIVEKKKGKFNLEKGLGFGLNDGIVKSTRKGKVTKTSEYSDEDARRVAKEEIAKEREKRDIVERLSSIELGDGPVGDYANQLASLTEEIPTMIPNNESPVLRRLNEKIDTHLDKENNIRS